MSKSATKADPTFSGLTAAPTKAELARLAKSHPKLAAAKRIGQPNTAPTKTGKITKVQHDTSNTHVIATADGRTVTYRRDRETAELRALAVVGGIFKVLEQAVKALPVVPAKLGRGLDGRSAPQSAAAASASQKGAGKVSVPAAAIGATVGLSKATAKRSATPKGDRAYTPGKTANGSKPATWTHYMIATALAHKSTAAAEAAHAKGGKFPGKKLDWKWMDAKGYIKLG